MTENEKRKPGRPKKVVEPETVALDEESPGRIAKPAEKLEAPLPVNVSTAPAHSAMGKRVLAPSARNIQDPATYEGAKPNKLQQALGTQPIVYYMGGGPVQIKPTHTSVVTLNDGTHARQTAPGFWLKRANAALPFSEAFDIDLDADKIQMVEDFRAANPQLCRDRETELYPWDGGNLAPPMDRWDMLKADAIKRVLLAGAADPVKCMKYELQKPIKRQDVIDAIEEAHAEIDALNEAAQVEAEINEARAQEASVAAVAV